MSEQTNTGSNDLLDVMPFITLSVDDEYATVSVDDAQLFKIKLNGKHTMSAVALHDNTALKINKLLIEAEIKSLKHWLTELNIDTELGIDRIKKRLTQLTELQEGKNNE